MHVESNKVTEVQLNLLGKMLLAGAGAWLLGKLTNLKIRGTVGEVNAVSGVLLASRDFQNELRNPAATVESVMQKLNTKNSAARIFESTLGMPWPL